MDFINNFIEDFVTCFIVKDRWKYIVEGLFNTVKISFVAVILGVVIGAIIAIIRTTYDKDYEDMNDGLSKTMLKIANAICQVYVTVIRGTPVMIQIMIMFFVIFSSTRNGTPVAMLTFGINSGAYVAEIIRSGIMAVDIGQQEAGRSLGLSYSSTMRFVILPQAIKNVLPALANEFIALLKETSVSCYVAVNDLTKGGEIIRSVTYVQAMPLLVVALLYLIMVVILSKLVGKLERRLRVNER